MTEVFGPPTYQLDLIRENLNNLIQRCRKSKQETTLLKKLVHERASEDFFPSIWYELDSNLLFRGWCIKFATGVKMGIFCVTTFEPIKIQTHSIPQNDRLNFPFVKDIHVDGGFLD